MLIVISHGHLSTVSGVENLAPNISASALVLLYKAALTQEILLSCVCGQDEKR